MPGMPALDTLQVKHAAAQLEPGQEAMQQPLLDCLLCVARCEGIVASAAAASAGLPLDEGGAIDAAMLVRAANRLGLAALPVERTLDEIPVTVMPAILILSDGRYAVVTDLKPELGLAILIHPGDDSHYQVSMPELAAVYTGHCFYLRPMQQFDARSPRIFQRVTGHWFWDVLKSSWHIYSDVLIASIFINLFVLAQPLFVMNVYDRVVPNNAIETLWALAIGVGLIYLFDLVLKNLRSLFVELAAKRTDVILSARLFEKVLDLRTGSRPVSVGAFANRLHEFDTIRSFITSSTILALVDLPFLLLFLFFLAWLGGWLALVPVLVFPLAIAWGLWTQKRLRPAVENVMRGASRKNATLIESLTGMETIKTLGAESRVQRNWEQAVGFVSQWSLTTRVTTNQSVQFVQFLQHFAMVTLIVWGVYIIADNMLTLGGLIACVILQGRVLAPLGQVANILTTYGYAEAALESLDDIMKLPVERPEDKRYLHRTNFRGDIQFRDVTFAYPSQPAPALKQVSLSIKAGEKVGIIGSIGSGKSTLGKTLIRLYDADSGAVLVDGFDVQQLDPAELRGSIGYLEQNVTLFFGTVRDNITFGLSAVEDQRVVEAAAKAGILELINRHPLGFDMPVGERGQNLSGGQRQLLGLARLFLRSPPMLILDEPTASMDPGTENRFRERLAQEARDKTLLLITHKRSLLELVDRLIVMDSGSVVADGPRDQVLNALRDGKLRGRV